MFRLHFKSQVLFHLFWLFLLVYPFYAQSSAKNSADVPAREKYITIDEIKPGMEAYCLTTYKGTNIEKFTLEVLSVVKNFEPGRDAILVQGTDERFIHTGPVAGCSGSPVYIDGRLAGALAFGWSFSKDPLYGVTPIEEMLSVGSAGNQEIRKSGEQMGYVFDFSVPIDFAEIDENIISAGFGKKNSLGVAAPLPCPLITSGLPGSVCESLDSLVGPLGLMAVSGPGGGSDEQTAEKVTLAPGSSLAIPLVTGDIKMTVIGTVTDVVGDDIYGFGHSFLGYGAVDLPMATGKVHTVVSSVLRSFKYATALETVGALTTDEATAIRGKIGAKAEMIPFKITVNRYNDPKERIYNCSVANNRLLTPLLLRSAVTGAALYRGAFPPDHAIEYEVDIKTNNAESISFENVSAGVGVSELVAEIAGSVALLMNNPYRQVGIESINFDIRQINENIASHIWSVDLSDSKVKAGEKIEIEAVIESVRRAKKKYTYSLELPRDLKPGEYELLVCGGYDYYDFLKRVAQHKFIAQNVPTLIEAMNNILKIKRDRLYFILVLPAGGIALEKAELPDLPATKALVLADAKRTLKVQPYQHWIEDSFQVGTIVVDSRAMKITVEK